MRMRRLVMVRGGVVRRRALGQLRAGLVRSVVGAELRLGFGDLAGARTMLAAAGNAQLSLVERKRAEDLLAEWAERSGDAETAVTARTRSRLIGRQLRDITEPGKVN